MNKKRMLFILILGVVLACAGFFYWQRQANYAKTRALFAPTYEYSGRLTPEEQKRYSEFVRSITNVEPSVAKKYVLPEREMLQLEAHSMTLYRNNPELMFMNSDPPFGIGTDVESYIRFFSIRALIAKTKIADLPSDSEKSIRLHLETLEKRLTKNSVEVYIQEIRDLPSRPRQKLPLRRFGVASAPGEIERRIGAKFGVIHIMDIYGNDYAIDLDAPKDPELTEDTDELYAEIDRIFEHLSDAEFQRLSGLNKAARSAEIEKLFENNN